MMNEMDWRGRKERMTTLEERERITVEEKAKSVKANDSC